ncbi:MAG: TolC family protein [Williamsia sp.]|nr:TolC family protein [Williamsia sp.]
MQRSFIYLLTIFLLCRINPAQAQQKTLSLKEALQKALTNYPAIKAKANYVKASKAALEGTYREHLPDLSLSVQQDYGTINGQSGPLYGFRGLGVSSGGPSMESQNWTGAFGALYLANFNWDFYSFGRVRERVRISKATLARDELDLEQEQFQHQVRVATAYLNLLAAQRLTRSQQNNLERAAALQNIVIARTKGGLNAGVDSSLANAEVSAARIALIRSRDVEQEQANDLAQLMGVLTQDFQLDTQFVSRIPTQIADTAKVDQQSHPLLRFFQSRVDVSNGQVRYLRTFNYPTFTLFSVLQGRGSGFKYNYGSSSPQAYSGKYFEGIQPQRSNYLVGAGVIWNLTSPLRNQQQVSAQKFTSQALQDEFELTSQQLKNQLLLAENKIKNALASYEEAPKQVKAAQDAYTQKSVLYKNGLTDVVDATQALYAVNRAETDRDIAFTNVWQALLLKAAASGDFGLFVNEF